MPDEMPEELIAPEPQPGISGREAYNVVTDTLTGPNVRWKDNVYQAAAIGVCTILGAGVGLLFIEDHLAAVLIGSLFGMLAGLFGSGIFLMIYRGVRHLRGKHD